MLTYAVEVCCVIGLMLLCLALPVTAIGFGIEALRGALRQKRKAGQERIAAA